MSSSKFTPPKFIDDASGYEDYKKKLLRWSRITKHDRKQQAEVVLYYLEGHPSGIQEKIDTALGNSIIDATDGMDRLIEYLDGIYEEDEMTNMWSKYKKFVRLKKEDDKPITEFIAEFETAYKEAKDNGCEVSDTVLALNLLESCRLSDTDEKFVLTAVDFKSGKENNNCLEQVKKSLRKFQSRDRLATDRFHATDEEAFIAEMKGALVADGWRPPASSSSENGVKVRRNSPAYKGLKNKLGADGKPFKCFHCGSEFHLAYDCDQKGEASEKMSTKKSSKSKPKQAEPTPTMLSSLLSSSKKYSMVCSSVSTCAFDSPLPGVVSCNQTLYDLLSSGTDQGTDLLSPASQSSLVCTSEFRDVNMQGGEDLTLNDLLVDMEISAETGPVLPSSASSSLADLLERGSGEDEVDDPVDNLVLVSQKEENLCYLVEEAGSRGVLDSGCSKSVAGVRWVGNYTNAISPDFAKEVKLSPSSEVYQFGGGEKRKSRGSVSVPALIGENRVFVTMDVVDAAIPLLIGTNSLKVGKANLDFDKSEATFFGEVVPMFEVGSGHFCINLVSENLLTFVEDVSEREKTVRDVLVAMDAVKVSDLKKLHHYYGHTPLDRLLKFLKAAGKDTDGLRSALIQIENSCESCIRSKRKKPRPKSAIPRVDGPDQILSVDLKEWRGKSNKRYICYMIDMFSRLTSAAFIQNKLPDTVVNCILEHWISKFGIFQGLHSDIGGEFSNAVLHDVASKLGVEVTTTASYSPHQNGLNERNHAVVDLMITRMLESDRHLSPDTALLWALNAKNSLENHLGYSPFQLHIGKNPRLLNAASDGPPSFDSESLSKNFVKHMNAMVSARENFIKLQSSDSLKKALKSKVHTRGHDIKEGDQIYYKKSDGKGKSVIWRGPSKVAAVNGKKLFIDQGAKLSTVNRDDAVRIGEELWRMDDDDKVSHKTPTNNDAHKREPKAGGGMKLRSRNKDTIVSAGKSIASPVVRSSSSSSSEVETESDSSDSENRTSDESTSFNLLGDYDETLADGLPDGASDVASEDNEAAVNSASGHSSDDSTVTSVEVGDNLVEHQEEVETEYEDAHESVGVSQCSPPVDLSYHDIKVGDIIEYCIPETDVVEISRVEERAAKATGPNKHWYNVVVQGSFDRKSVNMKVLRNLRRLDNAMSSHLTTLIVSIPRYLHNEPECLAAKAAELRNWKDFGVYREVKDVGQRKINTSWVLVRKDSGVKARLCIRGDQEPDKESIQTDSPTVNKVNIKLFYLIAVSHGWSIQTADVKAAFLQGSDIGRDVFVQPPKEARVPGWLWQMLKRAYGFVDASRGFYLEVEQTLVNLGCQVSRLDPAVFIYFNPEDNSLSGLMLTHVDDFIHGSGDQVFQRNVMIPLKERFKFGSEGDEDFLYVGLHVVQSDGQVVVDQNQYVDDLELPSSSTAGSQDALLDEEGQADFRSVVGRIGWVANSTRPDLSYDHLVLSMKLGKATGRDMNLACKSIKKIKLDGTQMKFVDMGPMSEWTLQGYGDAGFKSLPDKTSSCGGHVIMLSNKVRGLSCVLDWRSKKLKRVVTSSTAAEALAVNDALDMMVYLKSVLGELLGERCNDIPLELATDSRNLHNSVMTTSLVENPRLRTDIAVVKESLSSRELSKLFHVGGRRMLADVLTKNGAGGFRLLNLLRTCELVEM